MLPEILLSLSGHHSDIWERVKSGSGKSNGVHDYVSEPEKAMLEVLGHISQLHMEIRDTAARMAAAHSSVVCRAVSAAIDEKHLAAFRKEVLEVESAILSQNSGYVGGYGIVPLSTIVASFQPWARRLEWLMKVIEFASGSRTTIHPSTGCTSAALLGWLQKETQTGHTDLSRLATQLLMTGQKAWMKLAAPWILYGRLPAFGAEDFFVHRNPKAASVLDQYTVESPLIPSFVSAAAADSILAIGSALIHVQSHANPDNARTRKSTVHSTVATPGHLQALQALSYPINTSIFEGVLTQIDNSISQNVLSQLLPFESISCLLQAIRRYILLSDGEFAISLIEHATVRSIVRQQAQSTTRPVRKAGIIDALTIKDSELSSLLNKTWDELAALESDLSSEDEVFVFARRALVLRNPEKDVVVPVSTLLPIATVLDVRLAPDSTLALFLTPLDVQKYSSINAYLLSVRRTEIQLGSLWKLTSQRRCHPTPLGPPLSASAFGQQALRARRGREAARAAVMRQHWATSSKALFVLSELGAYFHGEVIRNSWERFGEWLDEMRVRPGSSSSKGQNSRPGTASSTKSQLLAGPNCGQRSDPRALAQAHHLFLNNLYTSLLLEDAELVSALKELLILVDHYVALFSRLESVWEGLDLQEDDGVVDAFSNFAQDEKELHGEMLRSRSRLEEQIAKLVQRLKSIEKERLVDAMTFSTGNLDIGRQGFVPWTPKTMDRLIMKLDFLSGMRNQSDDDDESMNDD